MEAFLRENLFSGPGGMRMAFVGLIGIVTLVAAFSGAGATPEADRFDIVETRAIELERDIKALGSALNSFAPTKPRIIGDSVAPVLVAQSSRDLASVNVRLGQMEEQIRVLTGQVEGLQFQMTQMQTLLERMQEDYEFRFQQLEGGSLGKTDAASQPGSATLSGELPQNQNSNLPDPVDLTAHDSVSIDGQDVLIDPDTAGGALDLSTPGQALGKLDNSDLSLGTQPLDLTFDPGGLVTDDDALAQYKAGYDAAVRGDYAFAEDQFRQFVGLFPDHPQAPEATNWLGEALLARGAYEEAADILLTGYQSYPNSERAPDLLFKLGLALAGAGERDTACRTFVEVSRRYPEAAVSLQEQISQELAKAQC